MSDAERVNWRLRAFFAEDEEDEEDASFEVDMDGSAGSSIMI